MVHTTDPDMCNMDCLKENTQSREDHAQMFSLNIICLIYLIKYIDIQINKNEENENEPNLIYDLLRMSTMFHY